MESALDRALDSLRAENIEAHLRFLSHPLLEGRGVGSRGGKLAEEYIRAAFVRAGLAAPSASGYRQEVPMIGMDPRPELEFASELGATLLTPRYRDEYVLEAGIPEEMIEVDAPLLFAGYGIHAPEFGWNDFEGVDVAGKILLVRVNDPGTAERADFFEGEALTYYGRWTYKYEEAARRGAAGVLLIHTDRSAGYGWNVVRSSNTGEQYHLAGPPPYPLPVRGWVTESFARSLLSSGGHDADELFAASSRPGFTASRLGVRVLATVRSTLREIETANVLGLRRGTDPARTQEPVVLMAHHDHLGVMIVDGEPVIYPGAYDNASGVALLLAIADALEAAGNSFSRPLLFLASTAEESGLLGSDWYTRHPLYPLARTAAVLNVDGANLLGPTDDIAPLGMNRSTLGSVVESAAAAESLTVTPEAHPEVGMFFRQDHFPFARVGVPGIAFDHGMLYRDRPVGWGEERYEEFVTKHYHQPSDAFREDFDYRGAVQQGRVMIRAAHAVAEGDSLPDWNPFSSFSRG